MIPWPSPGRRPHRNFQGYTTDQAAAIIAFGTSSIGRLPQVYVQNASRAPDYNAARSAGEPTTVRGVALSSDDRFRAPVIEQLMCFLNVDLQRIASEYAADTSELQPELAALDRLADEGVVERHDSQIIVPDHARLRRAVSDLTLDKLILKEAARGNY